MAEVSEVFSDLKTSGKKLFKDKGFVLLCVGVGLVALILWAIKQNRGTTTEETSEEVGYYTYGYPYGANDGYSDYDWFYDKLDALQEQYDMGLEKQDEKYDLLIDQMNTKYDQMLDKYDQMMEKLDSKDDSFDFVSGGPGYVSTGPSIDEQAIVDAMFQNSSMWWDTTTQAGRDALHDANLYMGGMIGATYDEDTGIWSKDGKPLYTVDKGDATAYVTEMGKKNIPASQMTYVSNVDYQSAINDAIRNGADASVINDLNILRDQKIADSGKTTEQANTNFDPNTDYQALINSAEAAGASRDVIDNLTAQRNAKIAATKSAMKTPATKK